MRRAKRRLVPVDVIEQLNRDLPKVRRMLEDEREDAKDKAHSCALAEERVREIHFPIVYDGTQRSCNVCFDEDGHPEEYPCPTIRALEGKPSESA